MSASTGRQKALTLLAVLAGAAVGWYAYGIFKKTPEEKVETAVRNACEAAQEKSILRLSDALTQDYRDDGGIDRATFMAQAQRFFMQTENLEVKPELVKVEMDGADKKKARALLVVRISGTEKAGGQRFQGIAGDGADAFLVRLREERGGWKVYGSKRLEGDSPDDLLRQIE